MRSVNPAKVAVAEMNALEIRAGAADIDDHQRHHPGRQVFVEAAE